jgi:hypothetical protein
VPKNTTDAILPIAHITRASNLLASGGARPRQKRIADSSSYRAPHPRERFRLRARIGFPGFEFRSSSFVFWVLRVNDAAAILR